MVAKLRAAELLRVLLAASVAVPVLLFVALGWVTYRVAFDDTAHELGWTSDVAREHAAKVFDSYKLAADQVDAILDGMDTDAIRQSEDRLSKRFRTLIAGLPQIESLIVLDRTGHLLVATDADPVNHSLDFADRDYFRALRDGASTFISRVQTSRIGGKTFFGWGLARHDASGAFDGVISIAVSPSFLQGFYGTLVSEVGQSLDGRVVTLIKNDGQLLVRYPPLPGAAPTVATTNPFFAAVQASPEGGTYVNRSLVDVGAPKRMYAFRKVPGHPVYVVAGRSLAAVRAEWRQGVLHDLALGIPASATLFLVTLAALRGARRERAALDQVRAEMMRREEAEGQLRQAQKMEAIGQLTGGIAHDFNNLLTVIRTSVDLLGRAGLPEPRRARYLAAISETTDRATRLTGQLLAFARRQSLKPEVFDVVAHVGSVIDMLRTLIGAGVSIEARLPDAPLHADADPSQFDACIVNLAVNARDAMDGQGHLIVLVTVVDGVPSLRGHEPVAGAHVAVSVVDTGVGIARDKLERVFEPFFTTKRKGEGTGLGLSQVFGFAKQSGGEVMVTSEPGVGANFTLYLPQAAAPSSPVSTEPKEDHGEPIRPGTCVLVVEDDPDVGAAVEGILADLGYAYVRSTDAEQALRELSLDHRRFALVFSDVVMPGMSGIELGQEVRRRYVDLPVVLTSGYSEVLAQNGTFGFELLHKPYSVEDLARTLGKASHWRRRRQELLRSVGAPG